MIFHPKWVGLALFNSEQEHIYQVVDVCMHEVWYYSMGLCVFFAYQEDRLWNPEWNFKFVMASVLASVCSFNLNQAPYFVDGTSSAVSSSHFGIRKRNMKCFSWAYMRTQGFKISKYFKKIAQCNDGFKFEKIFKIFLNLSYNIQKGCELKYVFE